MIDTHAHLQIAPLKNDAQGAYIRALQSGVSEILCIGTSIETSSEATVLAQNTPHIFAVVGIHPEEISTESVFSSWQSQLVQLASLPKVVGIGECGLDYCDIHPLESEKQQNMRALQKELFTIQIKLAQQANKPVSIHCRNHRSPDFVGSFDAYDDLLSILREVGVPEKGCILHCASGSQSYMRKALDMGAYISFAGNITYPSAQTIRDLVALVPDEKILVETDCPFLAPQSKRGNTNEPAFMTETLAMISSLRHISIEEADILTTKNARRCFDLDRIQ